MTATGADDAPASDALPPGPASASDAVPPGSAFASDAHSPRTRAALDAMTDAARALGLAADAPHVLHDVFSVVVHLAPSPVVARAPVVLPIGFGLADEAARQQRELDVAAWLDDRGLPVIRPSPLVPRAPVARAGLSISFWELADVDAAHEPDYAARVPLVASLHAALRPYDASLPFLSPVAMTVPSCLASLESSRDLIDAADLDRARREWDALAPLLTSRDAFARAFPHATVQPVHGDAPAYNMIATTAGLRYADFEDVTLAPPEWDLAFTGPDAIAAYDAAAARLGLRPTDPAVLSLMELARALQTVACLALVPQLPLLATGLAPFLAQWRAMPFAAGRA